MILNSSRARTFQACARKYYWEYVRRLRRREWSNWPIDLGVWFHEALARYYTNHSIEPPPAHWHEEDAPEDAGRTKVQYAEDLMVAYMRRYPLDDEIFQNHQKPEFPFRVALGDSGHEHVGIVDLLVQHADVEPGQLVVIDHKVLAPQVPPGRWAHNFAMWGYVYGAMQALELPVVGYQMNIIRKLKNAGTPKQGAPGKKGDPFVRTPVIEVSTEQIAVFLAQRNQTCERIVDEKVSLAFGSEKAFPMDDTACYDFNRPCPFLELCWGDPQFDWQPDAARWHEVPERYLFALFEEKPELDYVEEMQMEEVR